MGLKVLGVLAGRDLNLDELQKWAQSCDVLYAADSAADRLVPLGFKPTVVGDLDSVDPSLLGSELRVVHSPDPDTTDCDKLLALVENDGHTALTLACVEGDLLDHVLASLASVARSDLDIRLVLRNAMGYVCRPGKSISVPKCFGKRVSLIPLARSTGVVLQGVLWELSEAILEPAGFLSVSNEGTGDVFVSIASGVCLLFIERSPMDSPCW